MAAKSTEAGGQERPDEEEGGPKAESVSEAEGVAEPQAQPAEEGAPAPADEPAEPAAEAATEPQAPAATEVAPLPRRGGGFGAALAGGALAAVLGAGAMWLAAERGLIAGAQRGEELAGLSQRLEAQAERIAALEGGLASTREDLAAQLQGLATRLAELESAVGKIDSRLAGKAGTDELARLGERLDSLEARLNAIEVQPIPQAQLPEEVAAAYEAKLAAMKQEVADELARLSADLKARVEALEAEARSRLEELSKAAARAEEVEAAARKMENLAAARAAHARLLAALDAGRPFAAELKEIAERTGVEIPQPLAAAAETGVPTQAALLESFPEAARAAVVAATRAAAERGEVDRWTAFLRIQLGARSLEPREGDDADAILSRAEAALKAGDLAGALREIEALPPEGRAEMAGWEAQARTRLAALEAAEALGAALPETAQSN